MKVEGYNNVFKGNLVGVGVFAWGRAASEIAGGLMQVRLHDNVYLDNDQDANVSFLSFPSQGDQVYVKRTTIVVHDGDGVFAEEVETGPEVLPESL